MHTLEDQTRKVQIPGRAPTDAGVGLVRPRDFEKALLRGRLTLIADGFFHHEELDG